MYSSRVANAKNYYGIQDFRTKVEPGSFVYPYVNTPRTFSKHKLGPRWASPDQKLNPVIYLKEKTEIEVFQDTPFFRKALEKHCHKTGHFKCAKVHYVEWESFSNELLHHSAVEELALINGNKVVSYPLPIGMYLGEIIVMTHFKMITSRYYVKVLDLDGTTCWI